MNEIFKEIRTSIVATIILALILCGLYPVLVWGLGQIIFPKQANGSLIEDKNRQLVGSELLAQNFTGPKYFQPRPSAAGANGYDASSSSGSNLGPTSQKLIDQLKERVAAYRQLNGLAANALIPADAVTASGSGLDPHISPENAALQLPRVARECGLSEEQVRAEIDRATDRPFLGILGDPGVNVLQLNLALDAKSGPQG
jgi:potassium-transporting ATPase KdpC subunit